MPLRHSQRMEDCAGLFDVHAARTGESVGLEGVRVQVTVVKVFEEEKGVRVLREKCGMELLMADEDVTCQHEDGGAPDGRHGSQTQGEGAVLGREKLMRDVGVADEAQQVKDSGGRFELGDHGVQHLRVRVEVRIVEHGPAGVAVDETLVHTHDFDRGAHRPCQLFGDECQMVTKRANRTNQIFGNFVGVNRQARTGGCLIKHWRHVFICGNVISGRVQSIVHVARSAAGRRVVGLAGG